ncbi:(2Fe-2S) ferredoxin domain-containing protein [Paenibacillus dendritiformis]|uniref:2Fe-2S ferredoxin n=1 Tax=Paenibacillus dendritiformis C454 TaxID=1131935 RepID=H3S983_9BACL|nr:(2Fe-2S) ferredoxin domain-containing protein [Paenibacillus dendritiformis]EHQ64331.1 2Fe-2S ferredoxin [Paenibacillus dendritiformis C454]CAH8770456.1 (2Fe-2S) ferredoxin domain-containing protein [Paenibacillus dendritiformis]
MATWNLEETRHHLLICNGGSCMKQQADEVTQAIRDEISALGAKKQIHTTRTRCNGRCTDACVVIAYPEGVWYKEMTPELGRELVRKQLAGERLEEHTVYSYDRRFIATGRSVAGKDKPTS